MPKTGYFVLHSNVMPKVTAGQYELVSEHTGLPFTVAPATTHVNVAAPRYTMPTDQILSTFPPANAEGAFGDRLPQIVLKRRTLPWERNPAGLVATSPTPWLALVVVAEGEAQLSAATPVAQCVTPDTVLLDATTDKDVEQGLYLAVTETVVRKIFPCQADLPLLVHVREVDVNDTELASGDDDGWLAVVLANRLPVFDTAAGKPVRYMACLVNVEGQLAELPPPQPPVNVFNFELAQDWSVLAAVNSSVGPDTRVVGGIDIGNIVLPSIAGGLLDARPGSAAQAAPLRATSSSPVGPAMDGAATMTQQSVGQQWSTTTEKVAAVALDPDAKRLVRDTMGSGFRYPIEAFAIERVLRFPVLAHWSFTTNEGATFETLMQDVDVGLLGTIPERAKGAPPAGAPPPEIVETGHIGLGHRSRRGDAVRAWYRGPLVPFPTLRGTAGDGTLPILAHSADQIRRVVPDGREDLSLAAAFEIGRLLGLSQLSVVSALLRFRSEQFGIGRVRELLASVTPFAIPALTDSRIDLSRFVAVQMFGALVKSPDQMIGPRRPVADPGRPLVVRGDLDEVIASGLGLDLDAVRKAGEQVGILAAVAQAQVPIANTRGNVSLDKATLATMRGALAGELKSALDVAAPQLRTVPGGTTGGVPGGPILRPRSARVARSAAAPQRDALDALLDAAAERDEDES
ncbi:MAG: hypothetical protein ABIP93_00195 [Gemmatimonadaceae bacterium]